MESRHGLIVLDVLTMYHVALAQAKKNLCFPILENLLEVVNILILHLKKDIKPIDMYCSIVNILLDS